MTLTLGVEGTSNEPVSNMFTFESFGTGKPSFLCHPSGHGRITTDIAMVMPMPPGLRGRIDVMLFFGMNCVKMIIWTSNVAFSLTPCLLAVWPNCCAWVRGRTDPFTRPSRANSVGESSAVQLIRIPMRMTASGRLLRLFRSGVGGAVRCDPGRGVGPAKGAERVRAGDAWREVSPGRHRRGADDRAGTSRIQEAGENGRDVAAGDLRAAPGQVMLMGREGVSQDRAPRRGR